MGTKPKNTSDRRLLESVIEKLDGLNSRFEHLDKKVDLFVQKTEFEFRSLRELDVSQNRILEEHHQRSDQLKKDNELREASLRKELKSLTQRVEAVEEPQKFLVWSKKVAYFIIAMAGAVGAVAAFLTWMRGM